MNHLMEVLKISAMFQPKKIFLRHVSYDSSVSPLEMITKSYLRDFRISDFLLFRILGIPEAQSSETTVKDFLLKLWQLLYFGDH